MSDTKSAKNGIAFDAINAMTRTPVVIAVHVSWARKYRKKEENVTTFSSTLPLTLEN
jgi:hypothetical protein